MDNRTESYVSSKLCHNSKLAGKFWDICWPCGFLPHWKLNFMENICGKAQPEKYKLHG